MLNRIYNYFFDLGLYPALKNDFHLGGRNRLDSLKKNLWELSIFIFLGLGIICRELIDIKPLRLELSLFSWNTFLTSFIVGAIPFPLVIRQMTKNKRHEHGSVWLIVVPFGYGLSFNYIAYLALDSRSAKSSSIIKYLTSLIC